MMHPPLDEPGVKPMVHLCDALCPTLSRGPGLATIDMDGAKGDIANIDNRPTITELVKAVPLENFHFSQRRAVFEIGWKEFGQDLELRVHMEPEEVDEEP
jgi:hypothetical protein